MGTIPKQLYFAYLNYSKKIGINKKLKVDLLKIAIVDKRYMYFKRWAELWPYLEKDGIIIINKDASEETRGLKHKKSLKEYFKNGKID